MIRAIAIVQGKDLEAALKDHASAVSDLDLLAFYDNPGKAAEALHGDASIRLVFEEVGNGELVPLSQGNGLPAGVQRVVISSGSNGARAAIEQQADDYLLSPFSQERFKITIQKIRVQMDAVGTPNSGSLAQQKIPGHDDVIMVKVDTRMVKLHLHEITHIKGEGNYVTIYTTRGKWLVYHTMKKLEETLSAFQFVRVHKSYIVSFQHIDMIEKYVLHIRKEEIPISDSYKDSFLAFVASHSWMI